MKTIVIPETERYDEETCEFVLINKQELQIEHSLISLSKWEEKWHKSFLATKEKTAIEWLDYFQCMTLTKNVDPIVYFNITDEIAQEIYEYINDPMTATVITDLNRKPNKEIMTAEVIYYYMIALGIPFECRKWHLNKLMTLIAVCSIKNDAGKKMSKKDTINKYAELNRQRKKKYNTKG